MDNKKKGVFIAAIMVMAVFASFSMTVTAQAPSKTLYVISDMGQGTGTTTFEAYRLDGAGNIITPAAGSYTLPYHDLGAVAFSLDDVNNKLFVTWEVSNTIDVFDATNLNYITSFTVTGASNLAGQVVDTATNTLYVLDRRGTTIYTFSTLDYTAGPTGTISTGGYGLAFDQANNDLYVTHATPTVTTYDATNFVPGPSYNVGHLSVGIDVDYSNPANVVIYTTDNTGGPSGTQLTKYETATGATKFVTTFCPTGVTVDPDTGRVYITTARTQQGIEVYDTAMLILQQRHNLPDGWFPTDLDVGEVEFKPPAPVPTLTPIGLIALAGLLSVVAAMSISTRIRKRR